MPDRLLAAFTAGHPIDDDYAGWMEERLARTRFDAGTLTVADGRAEANGTWGGMRADATHLDGVDQGPLFLAFSPADFGAAMALPPTGDDRLPHRCRRRNVRRVRGRWGPDRPRDDRPLRRRPHPGGDGAARTRIEESALPEEDRAALRRFVDRFPSLTFVRDDEAALDRFEETDQVTLPPWFRETRSTLTFTVPGARVRVDAFRWADPRGQWGWRFGRPVGCRGAPPRPHALPLCVPTVPHRRGARVGSNLCP